MDAAKFREYQTELVGPAAGAHGRLAELIGTSEVGVKRYATEGRPIPEYIATSMRAMVLLHRLGKLKKLKEIP